MGILDLLFPKKCLGCGKIGEYFCSQCLNFTSVTNGEICPVCERPAIGGLTHPGCQSPGSLDGLTSIFAYKGLVKRAIVKLKYRFVSDLAKDLIELFLSFCGEDKTFSQFCQKKGVFFVPVPLHPRRKRWRGFSQTNLLGKMISENLGLSFLPDLLQRVKNTRPQVELKEKDRKENIKNAFGFSPNILISQYPNILLFDDVWTTGATLKEAGRTLKKAGAKKVWGLTLAR